jgi:hypothetical protein
VRRRLRAVIFWPVRLDRLRGGETLAGAGGVLLIGFMFLPWFGKTSRFCVPLPGYSCGHDFDAWQVFGLTDKLLLLAAIAGLAVAVLAASSPKTDTQITSAAMTVPVALLATVVVGYRMLNPVGQLDLRIGVYLGFVACLAITYGAWRAVRNDQPSTVVRRDRRRPASRKR